MKLFSASRLALGLLWVGMAGCGSSARTGPQPEVSLATSAEAQAQFRALREQWVSSALDARVGLERPLTRFVQRYPNDPQGRWARIYLAWISLQRGERELAERWLALSETGPAGAASDLLEVVRASLDLAAGRAEGAYRKLIELQGRLIDADDRLLCLDRLVVAAQANGQHQEAVLHMLELAAQAARRHRDRMWRSLAERLASIPLPVLEASLPTLSASAIQSSSVRPAERAAAVDWMRRQILDLLSRSAITEQDVELAQRLVASPATGAADEGDKSKLLLLATQGGLAPAVVGRTVGLALQLGDPTLRQRSIDVASGIALGLDLATGERGAEHVALQTRDVEGDALGQTLARLAGDGATLIVAGLDPRGARQAADFSARGGIPLLALHQPEGSPTDLAASVYVVGTDDAAANQVLRDALAPGLDALLTVGSPESPCPNHESSFAPLMGAAASNVRRGLLIEGGASCARNVLMGLAGSGRRWTIGLGLNALVVLGDDLRAHEVWTLGAGRLPQFEGARDAELERWLSRKGRAPSWYEALGHDVARIVDAALPAARPGVIRDPGAVSDAYRQVTAGLAQARLEGLWTSGAEKFGSDRHLPRQFRALRAPPNLVQTPR